MSYSSLLFTTVVLFASAHEMLFVLSPLSEEEEKYTGTDSKKYIHRGMERFKRGAIEKSVEDFDKVIELDKSKIPYMWQRGLSLYYLERHTAAAEQVLLA